MTKSLKAKKPKAKTKIKQIRRPKPKNKVAKKKTTVVEKLKKIIPSKDKPTKEDLLQDKLNASAAREKQVSAEMQPTITEKNKPVDFNNLTPEEQRKQLFGVFPGDAMGITVGKVDPNDPYQAMLPKESK